MPKDTTLRIETGHIEELIRKEIDRVFSAVKAAATTYREAFRMVDNLLEDSDGGIEALLRSRIHDYVRNQFEKEYFDAPIPKETPAGTEVSMKCPAGCDFFPLTKDLYCGKCGSALVSNRKCTHDQFARGEHLQAKELGRESNSKLRS